MANTTMHVLLRKDEIWFPKTSNIKETFKVSKSACKAIIESVAFRKAMTIMHICSRKIHLKIKEYKDTGLMEFAFYSPFEIWTRVVKKTEEWKDFDEFIKPYVIVEENE